MGGECQIRPTGESSHQAGWPDVKDWPSVGEKKGEQSTLPLPLACSAGERVGEKRPGALRAGGLRAG